MSSDGGACIRPAPEGCVIAVWAVPGASRSEVAGLHGDALRVRVTAPPENGAANREIVRLLAGALGVRPAALVVEAGATSRRKRVRVRGLEPATALRRLGVQGSVDTPAGEN
jgi:uncharacterized protein (TIGR00251 family)